MSIFGFDSAVTTLGHFGTGLTNQFDVSGSDFPNKMMASISHYMTLNLGDKIRVVAKTINGNTVTTTANAVRIRIRKKIQ